MRARAAQRVRRVTLRVACAQLRARPVWEARAALADILQAIRAAKRAAADVVVLPECSYPGYVLLDADPYRHGIPSDADALAAISREACRRGIAVAVGIARKHSDGKLRNEAAFIDSRGNVLGAYAKTRLWNFDRHWFTGGRTLPVFDTDFGRIGMMICADGRNPEIVRTLVAGGAWMILDPTAWVGSGPSHDAIHNVQADYMLRVRALESGIWIAAADKCGSELGAVHYAGRSQIVAPDGSIAAEANPISPQIIAADVRRTIAKPFVAILSDEARRTLRSRPHKPRRLTRVPPRLWLGVYMSQPGKRDDPLALRAIAAQTVHAIIRTGATARSVASALRRARGLRFAIIRGRDMLAPEPARAAALRGADLLVLMRPPKSLPVLEIGRTRAVENRVYVALCTQTNDKVAACLINPDGSVAGSALAGTASGFVAVVDTIMARRKEVVPGTQTFADRMPHIYRWPARRQDARKSSSRA